MLAIRVIAVFCAVCAWPASLSAQQTGGRFQGSTVDENAKKLEVGTPQRDLSGLGYQIAPNVVFQPTLTMESGYNTNPDEFFNDAEGSPYGLANATGVFGFLRDTGATTLTLRGTALQYDGDVQESKRWDAGLALDNAYAIAPGTLATFGGYYLRDEIALVPSNNAGGYGQLAYTQTGFETFGRIKLDQIDYLGSVTNENATPTELLLLQPSQFNMRRTEGVSGFIFGPKARIGVYSELGGANLDYRDQNVETILDRDATEVWAIGGLRFNLHPSLALDAGWRLNMRQVDDRQVDDQTTSFFDGRLTWTPLEALQIVLEVNRTFVEPLSTLAVVSDKIHYGASAYYRIGPGLDFSAALRHDQIDQIGDIFDYHETELSASLAYQWSARTTLYGLVVGEHGEEQSTGQTYDKLQVGGGARLKF